MHRGQSIIPANSAARHGTLRSPYTCTKCNQKYIVLSFQSALGIQQTPDPPRTQSMAGLLQHRRHFEHTILYTSRGVPGVTLRDGHLYPFKTNLLAAPFRTDALAIRMTGHHLPSGARTPAHTRTKAAHLSRVHADAYAGPWCIYLEVAAGGCQTCGTRKLRNRDAEPTLYQQVFEYIIVTHAGHS